MSMKKSNVPVGTVGYDVGVVTGEHLPEYLVGNILEIVEALGLREQQERSAKNIIREKIYDAFRYGVLVTPALHTKIHDASDKMKMGATGVISGGEVDLQDLV